ncbi:MAG: starvation-inducible DNA-binding protein [Ilumatobacter sp.]|jgi:starvation-inducible DNA-binding protein
MTTATTPSNNSLSYISGDGADEAVSIMQDRLVALLDLQLTLKHIHWNVVGPNFIAVHEMLDPQVDSIRLMSDSVAERIATTGGQPLGTPGAITATRSWSDYGINRAAVTDHLTELDDVYTGVITDHRAAASRFSELDPVTEDLFIGQLRDLELFQWFVRAHLQDASGTVN